jgi:hypothetical protein
MGAGWRIGVHRTYDTAVPRFRLARRGSLPELVRALPQRQLLSLWLAIFSTFAMIGFALDILGQGRQPAMLVALNVVASGLISVGYAIASMPMRPFGYAAMVAVHITYVLVVPRLFRFLPAAPPGRLTIDAIGIILTVTVSYISFLRFITVTATRFLRAQAEIAIARDIHRVLVPSVDTRIGNFEFLGWSQASGDVGGDLVDVIDRGDGWLGYVADVSGHGVGSGVVMGMFKSALRMRTRAGGSIAAVLDDIHAVLMPLKQPQMFVTVACVRASGNCIECAVAGHLPILRVRDGQVDEVTTPQIAVGMLEGTTFTSAPVDCRPGDVLALLTDGLVEVFDGGQQELGLDWAKGVLASSGGGDPLSAIADRLLAGARAHGAQMDDQTVLLIRRNQGAHS